MTTHPTDPDATTNARHKAHATADREYADTHPDYDPWAPGDNPDHTAYVTRRVAQLLTENQ